MINFKRNNNLLYILGEQSFQRMVFLLQNRQKLYKEICLPSRAFIPANFVHCYKYSFWYVFTWFLLANNHEFGEVIKIGTEKWTNDTNYCKGEGLCVCVLLHAITKLIWLKCNGDRSQIAAQIVWSIWDRFVVFI